MIVIAESLHDLPPDHGAPKQVMGIEQFDFIVRTKARGLGDVKLGGEDLIGLGIPLLVAAINCDHLRRVVQCRHRGDKSRTDNAIVIGQRVEIVPGCHV